MAKEKCLTETLVGVSQMTRVGNANKQARVQDCWWIECYSEIEVGNRESPKGTDIIRKRSHQASQKGMLRCVDTSQPLSSPTTTKSVIMLMGEEEEEEFFNHNQNHLKRHAHTPSGVGVDLKS